MTCLERGQRHVDGVGRLNFDFHTCVDRYAAGPSSTTLVPWVGGRRPFPGRGEGRVVEIPAEGVLATAPAASFSQTLAVAARGVGKRTELADRDAFVSEVRDLKASLEQGNVKEDFVEEAVQVFRFEPSRLELLANGESTDGIWDRFEWTRDADGAWSEPRRLMPY